MTADTEILDAFNRHQKTDKGFGNALGPDAARKAIAAFKNAGYMIVSAPSQWQANATKHAAFLRMLLYGWAEAAREIEPTKVKSIDRWLKKRFTQIVDKDLEVTVGHQDFFAVPR